MLQIEGLQTVFETGRGLVRAVNGVSLSVSPGEIVGIVGESGSGKSVTLLSILRLVNLPGRITGGQIRFDGADLLRLSPARIREIRGRDIAMVFQDPMTTLNPVFSVGEQVRESLRVHRLLVGASGALYRKEKDRVLQLMNEVGIPSPRHRYFSYPHELSGGMQQRMLVAIALAGEPKLLLADEPTTALDVTIQAQILDLLARINRTHGTAIILVTHNLGVASGFTQRLAVMYAGRIVETGPTEEVIEHPLHPYTQGLLRCIPRIGQRREKLEPIPGMVPDLVEMPPGCAFAPRCPHAGARCADETGLREREISAGHLVCCSLYAKGGERLD